MYTVEWTADAESELAAIWLAAADRAAVTAAAHRIDHDLATFPLIVGESRAAPVQRIVFFEPLYVEYDVIEDDRKVLVHAVGSTLP